MQKKSQGKLFVISGPSGVGKGTLCKMLVDGDKDGNIALSISMTTRKPRIGEVDGKHYFFVSKAEFKEIARNNGLLEYAIVYGNYYGTPRAKVMGQLSQGTDVVLEIDVQGALAVKKTCPQAILIFIMPPSIEELKRRITDRGTDSKQVIVKRISVAADEIAMLERYDYMVVNDDLNEAFGKIKSVITAEHCRV